MSNNRLLQFNYIPYPLWRMQIPAPIKPLLMPLLERIYPVAQDRNPPQTTAAIAEYLHSFHLMPQHGIPHLHELLDAALTQMRIETVSPPPDCPPEVTLPVRIPAQWERMEAVIVNWPIIYPPLWEMHAQMVEAIAPVAEAVITVPTPAWAAAAWLYIQQRGILDAPMLENVRILILPTDDVWVRDYGPFVGLNTEGQRVAFDAHYERQKPYGNLRDDVMPRWWGAHVGIPVLPLDLNTEGGNLWSDGAGTLIMTEQILNTNPQHGRMSLERYLHSLFDFHKMIVTPHMRVETTGHIDLMLKLADPTTVLVAAPTAPPGTGRLREIERIFRTETNACGDPYRVVTLPTPPLYFNWFYYPIRRSYTNALTVNGRVLVPIYKVPSDDDALYIYADAMPDYEIVPIDCSIGANGGGAVHCMTREVPSLL